MSWRTLQVTAVVARTLARSSQLVDADLRRVVSPRLATACDDQDILAVVRQVAVPKGSDNGIWNACTGRQSDSRY